MIESDFIPETDRERQLLALLYLVIERVGGAVNLPKAPDEIGRVTVQTHGNGWLKLKAVPNVPDGNN